MRSALNNNGVRWPRFESENVVGDAGLEPATFSV
jgi:hypothetical protein